MAVQIGGPGIGAGNTYIGSGPPPSTSGKDTTTSKRTGGGGGSDTAPPPVSVTDTRYKPAGTYKYLPPSERHSGWRTYKGESEGGLVSAYDPTTGQKRTPSEIQRLEGIAQQQRNINDAIRKAEQAKRTAAITGVRTQAMARKEGAMAKARTAVILGLSPKTTKSILGSNMGGELLAGSTLVGATVGSKGTLKYTPKEGESIYVKEVKPSDESIKHKHKLEGKYVPIDLGPPTERVKAAPPGGSGARIGLPGKEPYSSLPTRYIMELNPKIPTSGGPLGVMDMFVKDVGKLVTDPYSKLRQREMFFGEYGTTKSYATIQKEMKEKGVAIPKDLEIESAPYKPKSNVKNYLSFVSSLYKSEVPVSPEISSVKVNLANLGLETISKGEYSLKSPKFSSIIRPKMETVRGNAIFALGSEALLFKLTTPTFRTSTSPFRFEAKGTKSIFGYVVKENQFVQSVVRTEEVSPIMRMVGVPKYVDETKLLTTPVGEALIKPVEGGRAIRFARAGKEEYFLGSPEDVSKLKPIESSPVMIKGKAFQAKGTSVVTGELKYIKRVGKDIDIWGTGKTYSSEITPAYFEFDTKKIISSKVTLNPTQTSSLFASNMGKFKPVVSKPNMFVDKTLLDRGLIKVTQDIGTRVSYPTTRGYVFSENIWIGKTRKFAIGKGESLSKGYSSFRLPKPIKSAKVAKGIFTVQNMFKVDLNTGVIYQPVPSVQEMRGVGIAAKPAAWRLKTVVAAKGKIPTITSKTKPFVAERINARQFVDSLVKAFDKRKGIVKKSKPVKGMGVQIPVAAFRDYAAAEQVSRASQQVIAQTTEAGMASPKMIKQAPFKMSMAGTSTGGEIFAGKAFTIPQVTKGRGLQLFSGLNVNIPKSKTLRTIIKTSEKQILKTPTSFRYGVPSLTKGNALISLQGQSILQIPATKTGQTTSTKQIISQMEITKTAQQQKVTQKLQKKLIPKPIVKPISTGIVMKPISTPWSGGGWIDLPEFGGSKGFGTPKKTRMAKLAYAPSISSIVKQYRVKKAPKFVTGLELRPIIGLKRIKKLKSPKIKALKNKYLF